MNSLEAFNILKQIYTSNCMPAITQSEKELWDTIKHDLEVLEELRQLVKENANNEFIGVRVKRLLGD